MKLAVPFMAAACLSAIFAVTVAAATQPTITLSPASGPPKTTVAVHGTGFPPDEFVALYVDLPGPYVGQPGPKVTSDGTFDFTFAMPDRNFDKSGRVDATRVGPHTICGDTAFPGSSQLVAARACAQFVVESGPSPSAKPTITPNPASAPGTSVGAVLVVLAIMAALAAAAFLLLRRAG